jgi:hypothetical protein
LCGECGTRLFYRNAEILPGIVEVQLPTIDYKKGLPPTVQIQVRVRVALEHELSQSKRAFGPIKKRVLCAARPRVGLR